MATVGDGLLAFQKQVEELERRFTASGVPADHEDLLDFDDLTDEGSSDTSDGVPCTPCGEQQAVTLDHTVTEVKALWHSLRSAMHALASPNVVTAAAKAALTATAMHWGFSATGAAAAVIEKCEARLPHIFGSTCLAALGKILCVISSHAPAAIWRHVKRQQNAVGGSAVHARDGHDTMEMANAAWDDHYARRLRHGCQRRNRLIEQAFNSTASEIDELFAELDDAPHLGFSATAARVAGEAGDVWYGAHCYAIAYVEQVQRVLGGWASNMHDAKAQAPPSPATVTWGLVSDVLGSGTPGMRAMVQLMRTTCSRRQAGEDERGSFRVLRCLTLNMYAGRHAARETLARMAALYNQWRLFLACDMQQRLLTWRANAHSDICIPGVGYGCNMLVLAVCDVLHTSVWRSLHLWRAAAVTAGSLQQPRLWATKAVQPHIAVMARRSQRMQRAVTAMAITTPEKAAARRAEEAYQLRVAATMRFTDRASAVATVRARFMENMVRRATPQRLRQEAAREL